MISPWLLPVLFLTGLGAGFVDAIAGGASKRDAAAQVAAATGRRRRDVYQMVVESDASTPG